MDNTATTTGETAPTSGNRNGSIEKIAWWVVFGALTLGILVMLGAWN